MWNIVDDYVEADGYLTSFLVTRGHYTDFLLQAEFWPGAGANSGIFIRNGDPQAIDATGGYEINIFDTNENLDNRTGSVVNHLPPMGDGVDRGTMEYLRDHGTGQSHHRDAERHAHCDLEDDTHASGPIAFQNNGGLIRFRNIRLRPL